MSARVAVLTAVFDGYDTLKPFPAQSVDVEAICVTDDPKLEADGWHVLYEPRPDLHPNRAAKHPKCRPWTYTLARASVWLDASFRVMSSTFAEDVMRFADPIAQFRHPERDCVYDEADVSLGLEKYVHEAALIRVQCDRFRAAGHPRHWGLWANGLIARQHTRTVRIFGEAWLAECLRGSIQDQVSEAPLLREHGLRPTELPGWHGRNPWLRYEGSGRH